MNFELIRDAMVQARAVLITAVNEKYEEADAKTRQRVLMRKIELLTQAIKEIEPLHVD